MKKIMSLVFAFSLTLGAGAQTLSARAEVPAAVAIIDTGVNSALFTASIATEYCTVKYGSCPNGQSTMEGAGAANLTGTTNAYFDHGTRMASIILQVNPAIKIIPIRIVGMTKSGLPYLYDLGDVKNALGWVVANREKYNIAAVNISQGKIFPNCGVPEVMATQVAQLRAANVAVIASAGNDGNRSAMMSPACLPDVISVGATDNPHPGVQGIAYDSAAKPTIANYSNGNANTTVYINSRWYALNLAGQKKFSVGTSNGTAAFTGLWTLNLKASVAETLDGLMAKAIPTSNKWLSGKYVDIPH